MIIRQTINSATRHENMKSIKEKGAKGLETLIVNSLVSVQDFKFFLVNIFQEVVIDEMAEKMHSKISSLNNNNRVMVIEEMAKRYVKFAELGYVFTFKNYLDRV